MIRNNTLITFLFFTSQFAFSQAEKLLNGKIVVKNATPINVHIINLVNEKESISNKKGEFSIIGKADDLLMIWAEHLEPNRKIISVEEYNAGFLSIEMMTKIIELDEVEITKSKINAVDLGILSEPAKAYTPAERRLQTAGDFKPIQLLSILGGSLPLDPIINAISGRTKKLKGEVEIEKREMFLSRINELFSEEVFKTQMKIPNEYIQGFKYYLAEDVEFVNVINAKNKTMAMFIMSGLADKYKTLIAYEDK